MFRTAYDYDVVAFAALFLHNFVYFTHEGTCGIRDFTSCRLQLFIHLSGDSVGTLDNHGVFWYGHSCDLIAQTVVYDMDTPACQVTYDLLVMDDRSHRIYFSRIFFRLAVHHVDGSSHSETESGCLCHFYFHFFAILMISRTTSSIVISDESTRCASFACMSGECSLCISR